MEALATEPRLMPHLHLSLQAGDNLILKRMKRRHTREDAIRFCEEARRLRPGIVFGADIIAGFPTETEQMFARSLALVEDCGLTFLHVFPFSPRKGTPAARMPPVKGAEIKDRAARLRAAGEAALARHLAQWQGRQGPVLIETPRLGRTEDFTEVAFASDQPEGTILRARITGQADGRLTALPL
jgi:threonylcarbamoyladenosine tRNA methylthiotransferase MtaB